MKKVTNWIILLVLVVLPIIIIIPLLFDADPFNVNYSHNKGLVYSLGVVAICTAIYLLYKNYKTTKDILLNVVLIILLVVSSFIFYSAYSLSHFGF